jgi:hypothetical protein
MRLLAIVLAIFPILANGGEPIHPRDLADAFFSSVRAGDFSDAYDHLFAGSSMVTEAPQQVTTAKAQTAAQLPLYGKILGVDFLRQEPYGTSSFGFSTSCVARRCLLYGTLPFTSPRIRGCLLESLSTLISQLSAEPFLRSNN